MPRPRVSAPSRDRLLAAAAAEFAARGYDGAKVDRIAARARVNKAMLYYHFPSKAGLYREILHGIFQDVATAVAEARALGGTPADQIARFVATIARNGVGRPGFPAIWLREMADGGRRIDAGIAAELGRVLGVLEAILADGRRQGVFRPAHPFVTHLGIVAPLLLFAASAPVRARVGRQGARTMDVPADAMVGHVQHATLAALTPVPARGRRSGRSRSRTRS